MLLYCTVSTLNPIAATTHTHTHTHTRHHIKSNNSNQQQEWRVGKSELTWDRGDDLSHLQPICETKQSTRKDQNRGTLAEQNRRSAGGTAEIRGGRGDGTGRVRLTEYGGLAGIVQAEDEDASLAVAEDRREEPRKDDAHGDARGLAPAAAQGFGSAGHGAERDLGFWGKDGGRSGEGKGRRRWSELARASTEDENDDSATGEEPLGSVRKPPEGRAMMVGFFFPPFFFLLVDSLFILFGIGKLGKNYGGLGELWWV